MKLDGATIAIERRSVGACIDLAVLFVGAHLLPIIELTLCFALPACLATYWLATQFDAGLWIGISLYFVGAPFLGAAMVVGAGHRAFGDSFGVWSSIRLLVSRLHWLIFSILLVRLLTAAAALACIFPALLPAVRYGFLPEVSLLEQVRAGRQGSRLSDLMRGAFFDLLARYLVISLFTCCMAISFFSLVDVTFQFILGIPILSGRISGDFFLDDITTLLHHDPKVITLLCGALWLVYPLGRLAWFFCYLDTRIEKEAWDVELDFRVEAQRLQPAEGTAA